MRETINLYGNNEEYLSINLCQVLKQIENGNLYFWKILWVSGFGKTIKNETIMSLEEQINNSKDGMLYTWDRLFDFTLGTLRFEDFLLLGDTDLKKLYRYESDEVMKQNCEFCIELVDSSFWEITTSNTSFLNNVKVNLL